MKKLLVLSGKGGTGKTTIASCLIKLTDAQVFADCDVDAPNLHLVQKDLGEVQQSDFIGSNKAKIKQDLCLKCGVCYQNCRFDAIEETTTGYEVNQFSCEGCGLCQRLCPVNAIEFNPAKAGDLLLYKDKKVFSTAKLLMGSGTSGKLVADVKKQIKDENAPLAIIDGSPGIGCPVIASISGVDLVLVVSEPSQSGISDMKRIIETSQKFGVETIVCINKYNISEKNSNEIEEYCRQQNITMVGKIPYDEQATKLVNEKSLLIDKPGKASNEIKNIYKKIMKIMEK